MINVFNSPIEASSIDEFTEQRTDKDAIFDKRKRRPKVEYTSDGRKVIDGVVTDEQAPNSLWATTISRGMANEWKAKASTGHFYKMKHYATIVSHDMKDFIRRSMRNYGTPILLVTNLCLSLMIFRLFKII